MIVNVVLIKWFNTIITLGLQVHEYIPKDEKGAVLEGDSVLYACKVIEDKIDSKL